MVSRSPSLTTELMPQHAHRAAAPPTGAGKVCNCAGTGLRDGRKRRDQRKCEGETGFHESKCVSCQAALQTPGRLRLGSFRPAEIADAFVGVARLGLLGRLVARGCTMGSLTMHRPGGRTQPG